MHYIANQPFICQFPPDPKVFAYKPGEVILNFHTWPDHSRIALLATNKVRADYSSEGDPVSRNPEMHERAKSDAILNANAERRSREDEARQAAREVADVIAEAPRLEGPEDLEDRANGATGVSTDAPFVCDVCSASYRSAGPLAKHKKRLHGVVPVEAVADGS